MFFHNLAERSTLIHLVPRLFLPRYCIVYINYIYSGAWSMCGHLHNSATRCQMCVFYHPHLLDSHSLIWRAVWNLSLCLYIQNGNIYVMRSWRPWGEKSQMYCVADDGAKVALPAAVWAAGTLCSTGLFEQLITEGSQPAYMLKWFSCS